jgi:hypothetical protein
MTRNAALLAFVLVPAMADARCVELTYTFEGQVLTESGKPAVGALVGASWLEFGQAAGPAFAVADGDGFYRLSVRFRPGDDMQLIGPACTERLNRINVIAYTNDRRSYPAQVQVSGPKQKLPSLKISEPVASPASRGANLPLERTAFAVR